MAHTRLLLRTGCPPNSPLLRGGGFAGAFVENTYGYGGSVSIGQTVQVSGVACLSFIAVSTSRLIANIHTSQDAANYLSDPYTYRSIPSIAGCNTTSVCNITYSGLNTSTSYTILYQPDYGAPFTSQFVGYSLVPGELPPDSKHACVHALFCGHVGIDERFGDIGDQSASSSLI